jgi:hypothetical protein
MTRNSCSLQAMKRPERTSRTPIHENRRGVQPVLRLVRATESRTRSPLETDVAPMPPP